MNVTPKRRRLHNENSEEDSVSGNEESGSDLYDPPSEFTVHSDSECSDSGSEDSDDTKQLKNELLDVLARILKEKNADFAVSNISTELPTSPGIKISGYGTVSLPVTEMTVKDLRKHFQQAPYGLGEDTLIDKAVRDSWQLDPEKFEITNPKFNAGVEKLVKEIQDGLGCSKQKVTSHLYKLLLYEPGGHFKPHRDTEKHSGMFATLIIQAPSIFTGGDLVVRHNTREKRIAFGTPESEFSCMYAAHYADCEHELTEITSGYRMALVYSLCWDGNGVVPSPPDIPTTKLASLLKQIGQVLPHPHMIAWGLDHHYSQKSLLRKGVQALKGGDKLIYSAVQGANAILEEDKKLDFFIVEAKKIDTLFGSCMREYDEWYGGYQRGNCDAEDCFEDHSDGETEYKFNVFGTDGKPLKNSSGFRLNARKYVLNVGEDDEKFWGKCTNEGKCSGPSGNEGATKTNWYRRHVLLIFPKENAFKVVYKNSVKEGIDYLVQQLDSKDTSVRKLASDTVELCVEQKQKFCGYEENVITMLKLISKMKELEFAMRILPLLSEPLFSYSWIAKKWESAFGIPSEKMISVLKDLISAFSWQQLSDPLTRLIKSCPPDHYKHAVMFLEQCPDDVPKEKLLASMVENAVSYTGESESKLTDESIEVISGIILSHPKSCSQFMQPFLDLPKLQNLQILTSLLSLFEKEMGKKIKKSKLYEMTFIKFSEQLHKLFHGGSVTSASDVDAIVKGAEFLVRMQENTLLEKLVEDVLQNPSAPLLQKLLASTLCQQANVLEQVKPLIEVRINQLLPIVQAGEPKFSWCQPTAVIPGHPEVQAFLRGSERKFVYRRFNGKGQARKFERDYFRGRGNAVVNVTGSRSDTVVEITKVPVDKMKHEEAVRNYNRDFAELKRLQTKLGVECE